MLAHDTEKMGSFHLHRIGFFIRMSSIRNNGANEVLSTPTVAILHRKCRIYQKSFVTIAL